MVATKEAPRKLASRQQRQMARQMRDWQWKFMEKVARLGTLWVCWWNKDRHHDEENAPEDLEICGLIDGSELLGWMNSHRNWWRIGKWSDKRYAAPVRLTPAGKKALKNRRKYDMEPVTGGMVEPGWQAIPAKKKAVNP